MSITGSLKIAGDETKEQDIFRLSKKIGTVLQDSDGQFVGLTVGEDIAFSLENDCVPQPEMKLRGKSDCRRWWIWRGIWLLRLLSFRVDKNSGRHLAGVMVDDVDVLLFDEPLANLDPATGKQAIEIIDDIHQETAVKQSLLSNIGWKMFCIARLTVII